MVGFRLSNRLLTSIKLVMLSGLITYWCMRLIMIFIMLLLLLIHLSRWVCKQVHAWLFAQSRSTNLVKIPSRIGAYVSRVDYIISVYYNTSARNIRSLVTSFQMWPIGVIILVFWLIHLPRLDANYACIPWMKVSPQSYIYNRVFRLVFRRELLQKWLKSIIRPPLNF